MHYYKILRENKTHHGLVYREGLNVDPEPFDPSGNCLPGGIYFTRKDVFAFLWMGLLICKVTLPEDARVYKNPGKPEKWKTDKVILDRPRKINLAIIKELVEAGADAHVDSHVLLWASRWGCLSVVKYLVEDGANISINNNHALRWASGCGHLSVVKYLAENGVDIRTDGAGALRLASRYNNLNIVKYLVKNGAYIYDHVLQWVSGYGHLSIVKYLVESGVDVHANSDGALRSASKHNHLNVVKYLKSLS